MRRLTPRRHRFVVTLALMLGLTLLLPVIPYAITAADNEAAPKAPVGYLNNPGGDLWRAVRQGDTFGTQARGVDTGVLIRDSGERWRSARVQQVIPYSAAAMGAVLLLFALYYLIRGPIRIEKGRSGKVIPRYDRYQMWIHWVAATLFVVLMLTGLILLYGKLVLIPLLGKEGFSATAYAAKLIHNYAGPVFAVVLILMFFAFVKEALFNLKVDTKWFLAAGGYLGGRHPSAEKINAGQKAWFWVATGIGLLIAASGLVLDFPQFGQGREVMQLAHLVHMATAFFTILFFFVHLYLASIGVEGALEAMVSGKVDANWAAQHHDLWYAEVKDQAVPAPGSPSKSPGTTGAGTAEQV
jgi:formate dehydrogenase subunit gamma